MRILFAIGAAAVALGAYFHPLPMAKNWGEIAAKDMEAKAGVATQIKQEIASYSEDGRWDAGEIIYILDLTSPRRFTEHRTDEMRPAWNGGTYLEALHPRFALEDELYNTYNSFLSDGTRGLPIGALASYHDPRRALVGDLYRMFIGKIRATFDEWRKLKKLFVLTAGIETAEELERGSKGLLSHYQGSINLGQTQIGQRLQEELERAEAFFSSKANHNALRQRAESLGNERDRMYNGLIFGAATLAGAALMGSKKKQNYSSTRKQT